MSSVVSREVIMPSARAFAAGSDRGMAWPLLAPWPLASRPPQGHQGVPDRRQDRSARSLRQADRDRLHDGARVPDQGHHEGRQRQARGHRQGRPAQARPRQVAAGGVLRRRQGRHRRRHHGLAGRARHAAGGRGAQEDADRRAGGGRQHHRRQVEPLHLPHRAQLLPGRAWPAPPRTRRPAMSRSACWASTPPSAATASPPSSRRWRACGPTSRSSPRNMPPATRRTSRRSPSGCSMR